MTPAFAVITPSYQQARYLERTIRSVLAQAPVPFEYFVADGGSTDGSVDVLRRYSSQLRFVSGKDAGQADAVNKGILATTAPIIAWINSDDVYFPGAFAAVSAFLDANPDVEVVYGRAHHIGPGDEYLEDYPAEPFDLPRLLETCFVCQPAAFFRRSVVEKFGLLDASLHYALDYEYWIRLAQAGARFAFLDALLAGSRLYPETKTLGARVKVHAEINTMLKHRLGCVPSRWIFNYAHAVADDRGIPRSDLWPFARAISIESWRASLRWNRRLSGEVVSTTLSWLRDGFHHRAHRSPSP